MTVHYPTAAGQLYRRYPFFRSTLFERRMLFERNPAVAHQPSSQPQGIRRRPFVERAPARVAG
jgi:hypothetical protein